MGVADICWVSVEHEKSGNFSSLSIKCIGVGRYLIIGASFEGISIVYYILYINVRFL